MRQARRPILVTGAIRTGTTWVGRVLGTTPGVAVIHEPFNIDHPPGIFAHRWPHQYAYVAEDDDAHVARAMADTLAFRYRPLFHLGHYDNPRRSMGLVRDLPRSWYRRIVSRPRPLLKDPIAVFSAEWLADRFDMDVVVLVRHPAAFATSYRRIHEPNRFPDLLAQPSLMAGPLAPFSGDIHRASREDDPIVRAAILWRVVYAVVDDYRSRHPRWEIRRHEDLALRPFDTFPILFERLGLGFTPNARRFLRATTDPANPVEAPPGTLHQLRRDSRRLVSEWKERLSPAEVNRIRRHTGEVADRFYPSETWTDPGRDDSFTGTTPGPPPACPSPSYSSR